MDKFGKVESLLREPFQVQKLRTHILHDINHLEVSLLILVCEPNIQPIESCLRALSLLPFRGLGFLLSFGRIAGHFSEQGLKVEERLGFWKRQL